MKKSLNPALMKKMSALALKARGKAYAPYSHHPVGAAILAGSGKVYAGANYETAHYKSICAEASAIAALVSAGEREIRAVVVAGPGARDLATPCGDCRQRIREFASGNILICSLWRDGSLGRIATLDEILPYSFGPENIAEVKKEKNGKRRAKAR